MKIKDLFLCIFKSESITNILILFLTKNLGPKEKPFYAEQIKKLVVKENNVVLCDFNYYSKNNSLLKF